MRCFILLLFIISAFTAKIKSKSFLSDLSSESSEGFLGDVASIISNNINYLNIIDSVKDSYEHSNYNGILAAPLPEIFAAAANSRLNILGLVYEYVDEFVEKKRNYNARYNHIVAAESFKNDLNAPRMPLCQICRIFIDLVEQGQCNFLKLLTEARIVNGAVDVHVDRAMEAVTTLLNQCSFGLNEKGFGSTTLNQQLASCADSLKRPIIVSGIPDLPRLTLPPKLTLQERKWKLLYKEIVKAAFKVDGRVSWLFEARDRVSWKAAVSQITVAVLKEAFVSLGIQFWGIESVDKIIQYLQSKGDALDAVSQFNTILWKYLATPLALAGSCELLTAYHRRCMNNHQKIEICLEETNVKAMFNLESVCLEFLDGYSDGNKAGPFHQSFKSFQNAMLNINGFSAFSSSALVPPQEYEIVSYLLRDIDEFSKAKKVLFRPTVKPKSALSLDSVFNFLQIDAVEDAIKHFFNIHLEYSIVPAGTLTFAETEASTTDGNSDEKNNVEKILHMKAPSRIHDILDRLKTIYDNESEALVNSLNNEKNDKVADKRVVQIPSDAFYDPQLERRCYTEVNSADGIALWSDHRKDTKTNVDHLYATVPEMTLEEFIGEDIKIDIFKKTHKK